MTSATIANPLAFIPQQVRDLITSGTEIEFPRVEYTDTGLVAIIDISGYSKLSSHLKNVLGNDSGARIKELLNPPINTIIDSIHHTGGSVIKFAGDAVIAAWSHSSSSESTSEAMILNGILCSLNLLIYFRSHIIEVDDMVETHSSTSRPINKHHKLTDSERNSESYQSPTQSASKHFTKVQKHLEVDSQTSSGTGKTLRSSKMLHQLKIHIGLGYGYSQLVLIGDKSKTEYFVTGKALSEAGVLLDVGKQGDMCFSQQFFDVVKNRLGDLQGLLKKVRTAEVPGTGAALIVNEKDNLELLGSRIRDILSEMDFKNGQLGTGNEDLFDGSGQNLSMGRILPFVDDALNSTLSQVTMHSEESISNRVSTLMSQFDQVRNVSVLFIHFSQKSAQFGQTVLLPILKTLRKYEGCMRQFNCDDKALTALLVWGLQGHAHEKGEATYALHAAMEITSKLNSLIGDQFSIGVTSGSVFSGIVGNNNRADGTVLGVAVNNAARIMCLEMCRGIALCDEETYLEAQEVFSFDEGIQPVVLKGVPNPVKIYRPLAEIKRETVSETNVVSGRKKEVNAIISAVQVWNSGQSKRLLIKGVSGSGKTTLMHYCINAMKTVPNTLICVGFGQEHQHNTMLFIYSRLLSDLFNNIKKNQSFVKLTTSAIKSARRDSSVTSGRPSSIHTRNSQAAEHRDFISTMFPRAYQDLLSYVPGLFSKRDVFISGSINNISQVSDLVSKLSNLISKILNELNRGCRIMFVLDDLQWSDSYSLDLTYQLMQRCPHIFFLFVSRPEEEYKESLKNDLRKIAESENTESLFLGPLDAAGISEMVENGLRGKYPTFKSVDPVIVTDIMEQSQGNALIASSLVVMLKEDSNIGVDMTSGMLVCRTGKMAKNATAGSLAVILAQFDKQPSELKNILRIASVAGQYFNINEVRSILIHRKEAAASTAEEMVQLLLSLDKYKFIKTTDDPAILMFSHFLIQQGIYTSLVPATRIEIHGAFADLYEVGDEVDYSRLIFHLLKVEGQNERKQRVLYAAFLESASALRVKESLEYDTLLSSFEPRVDFATTPLLKATELRHRAQLHLEMHDFLASVQHCIQALEVLGFKYPRSNAAILGRLMKTINTIKRILKSDEMTRQQISKRYTTKNFIAAFKDIAQSDTESRAHQIVLSEVIMVSELLTKSLILLRPNIEILFAITQLTILSENILDNRDLLLGSCYARCVPVFGVLHFSKSYSRCDARSKVLLMDLELIVENITAESATYLGFIHEARNLECLREGNMFQACLHQRSFVNILDRVGLNYTETGYAIRCRYHSTEITLGNYQNYADAIDKDSELFILENGKEYSLAQLWIIQASYEISQDNIEKASDYHSKCIKYIRMHRSTKNFSLMRATSDEAFISRYLIARISEPGNENLDNLYQALEQSLTNLSSYYNRMNRLERTFGMPSILTLLPSMIDHVLEQRYVPTTTQYIDAVIKVAKGRNVLCKFLSGMLKALNHLVSGKWELFCTQAQSLVQQSNGEPFLTDYLQKLFEFKIRKVRAVRSSNAKNNLGLKEQVSVLVRFFRNHNYKWDDKNATTLLDYLREV